MAAASARSRTRVPDGSRRQEPTARKDPAPRPVGPFMPVLEGTDSERFYVWSPPGSDDFEARMDMGYQQEFFGEGVTLRHGRTGKAGDPIKNRDCVLLSCPKELREAQAEEANRLANLRERMMRDPRGLRRMAGEGSSDFFADEPDDGLVTEGRMR